MAGSGDGVQWLSQGLVSAAAVTLAQGSAQGGSGIMKGSAGRPWLVQERTGAAVAAGCGSGRRR